MQLSSRTLRWELFAASALFLFLELVFIRWFPAQVLFLTFFTNTLLLASFLGLSLGCLTARTSRSFFVLTPVLLAVGIAVGTGMESVRLALQDVVDVGSNKTSPQMVYFGSEARVADVANFIVPIEVVAALIFALVALTMVGIGQTIGRRFAQLPNSLEGYIWNIGGSLLGVLLFELCSWKLSPIWWFTIVGVGLLYFLFRETKRNWWSAACCLATPLLLLIPEYYSMGVIRQKFPHETWSPYYRINYSAESRTIVVNLIGHQTMVSRNDPFPAYAVPYLLNRDIGKPRFHDILIIGAGSGNDVSRALQWTEPDSHIDAVEIDPVIQSIGARDHPDKPYQDPRVTVHLGDGRNFLRSTTKKYDLIVYALIDSLVLHSSVSNIRLESYLFTREAMADVRRCLKDDGLFAMYNYFRRGWIVSRLEKTLEDVYASSPVVLTFPQQNAIKSEDVANGFTIFLAGARAASIAKAFQDHAEYTVTADRSPGPDSPNGFVANSADSPIRLRPAHVEVPMNLKIAEDEWPFLYLRAPMIPAISWRGALLIAVLSLVLLWWFGWRPMDFAVRSPHCALFFLGAAFMLLETKAVVHMALVFGGTWVVNTVVFSAILIVILAANIWVLKRRPDSIGRYYAGLFLTLGANVLVPLHSFLGWTPGLQAIAAAALVFSPVLFASIVFATLFRTSDKPEQALAYNTAGAILGGLAENASLVIGFRYLLLATALLYALAWLAQRTSKADERSAAIAVPTS